MFHHFTQARILTPMNTVTSAMPHSDERVQIDGKLFRCGGQRWYVKGFTYGPFAPNRAGAFLPERHQMLEDFRQMRRIGANVIRLYHAPSAEMLDDAISQGLRVFVDVPWEKHRCFFEDWSAVESARQLVRDTARTIGAHPGIFAISVGNEIPKDVVRYYGHNRIERFLAGLIDALKQEAPGCLATYSNYPSTEFLIPPSCDFFCYNVYLEKAETLGLYVDRLQHIAGNAPLVLGEFGVDSLRHGAKRQAELLSDHIQCVFRHGLAGSFVFSYTDDWFTGGHRITDWAFGVTSTDRVEKPAAELLNHAWRDPLDLGSAASLPPVSVVVCSYNGGSTLDECLHSIQRLNYPNYEVILVDDGSTDRTPEIAARYPRVRYIRQENMGLSAARNIGARMARGEIVAYTDSDCVVDQDWLTYLVRAMRDQEAHAIGGPNIPPPSDCWIAKCVAASPGGPSHVMLDDRRAEHIPGCNMAFDRGTLLSLGGFDDRFRVAGDDVDICWRLLDADLRIGYAPAAFVWHHRRTSVRAYLKQQAGYGRSEAMLRFKHPARFNALGCSRWNGTIYGEGAVGLPVPSPTIYHGRFGAAPFQIIYRDRTYSAWAYFTLLEWHVIAAMSAAAALLLPMLGLMSLAMWTATLAAIVRAARLAPLPEAAPRWCRPLLGVMYLLQPVVRAAHRYRLRFRRRRLPSAVPARRMGPRVGLAAVIHGTLDLFWRSRDGIGREQLLEMTTARAGASGWASVRGEAWARWDLSLAGDTIHDVRMYSATEELGGANRFTRIRCTLRPTGFMVAMSIALLVAAAAATVAVTEFGLHRASMPLLAIPLALPGWLALICISRRRCLLAARELLCRSGRRVKLGMPLGQAKRARQLPLRHRTPRNDEAFGNETEWASVE